MTRDATSDQPARRPTVERVAAPEWEPPARGTWHWVTVLDHEAGEEKTVRKLGCVTEVGTNYVEFTMPGARWTSSVRYHFDAVCANSEPEPDAERILASYVERHRVEALRLMTEVRELTARLAITPANALPDAAQETRALAVRSSEPLHEYKSALIRAKEETLPDLFKRIRAENEAMATWMQAGLIPLKADLEAMRDIEGAIKGRIFNVELYAGLVEQMAEVRGGDPAAADERIRLFQRRCYMDEECLARYEAGGMEFKDLHSFDRWLLRPENLSRLLPFPRCIVAFQVRRRTKDRSDVDLYQYIRMLLEGVQEADKLTFLYIRNGEQVHRLSTGIDFGAQLFPDADHSRYEGVLYARRDGSHFVVISGGEYEGRVQEWRDRRRTTKKADRWRIGADPREQYFEWTPESVYYDDVSRQIGRAIDEHNRLVLVLQGLLDRSPALHPHPAWKLWTGEGFMAAFEPIYDDARALDSGAAPDFEAYRRRINAGLRVGDVTVGQEDYWEEKEAGRENERQSRDWRIRNPSEHKRFRPYGDPGPGTLAKVLKLGRPGAVYEWWRERLRPERYGPTDDIRRTVTVPTERLLNADAYTPGDYRLFFDDHRTRKDYLQWAPLLLEAEEYHAGNREVGRPHRG